MGLAALLGLLVIALGGQTPQPSPSPESRSVWENIYSPKQAERGQDFYHENCSSCHGDKLSGKAEEDIPPLAGARFTSDWNGRTVGDLYKKILRTMPQDDPGRLNGQQSADVVAFILSFNLFPAGDSELPGDEKVLSGIRIERTRQGKKAGLFH